MAENPESTDQMFPTLDQAQIARLTAFGQQGQAEAGAILFEQGDAIHGIFIVLEGSIEILGISRDQSIVRVLGPGMFTGELNMLSGRRSLVRCRTREASLILEINRENLRRIFQTDSGLGETLLRAFLLRRTYLIDHSAGDALLIGSSHSADTLRLR